MGKLKKTGRENRIWIELEKPVDDEHGKQIAELANNMLHRIVGHPPERQFYWNDYRKVFDWGNTMGRSAQVDRGVWLNLDYLGRPLTEK